MTPNNYVKSVVRDDAGRVVRHDVCTFRDAGDAAGLARVLAFIDAQPSAAELSVWRPALGCARVIGVGGGF